MPSLSATVPCVCSEKKKKINQVCVSHICIVCCFVPHAMHKKGEETQNNNNSDKHNRVHDSKYCENRKNNYIEASKQIEKEDMYMVNYQSVPLTQSIGYGSRYDLCAFLCPVLYEKKKKNVTNKQKNVKRKNRVLFIGKEKKRKESPKIAEKSLASMTIVAHNRATLRE